MFKWRLESVLVTVVIAFVHERIGYWGYSAVAQHPTFHVTSDCNNCFGVKTQDQYKLGWHRARWSIKTVLVETRAGMSNTLCGGSTFSEFEVITLYGFA